MGRRCGHRVAWPGRAVLAVLAVAVLLGTACSVDVDVEVDGSELAVTEVVASSAIDADGTPTAVTSSFDADTPVIYVAALVAGAEAGATLTMSWQHDREGAFAEVPIALLEGSSRPYSEFTRPDAGWPLGGYLVELVARNPDGGTVDQQVGFQVASAGADQPADDAGDPAADADGAPGVAGPSFATPEGFPERFPLPGADGTAFEVPGEERLFAVSLQMPVADAVAFYDEAPGPLGWSTLVRDDHDADVPGVLYLLQGHGQTLIVVVGPDDAGPGESLVAVQVDPAL